MLVPGMLCTVMDPFLPQRTRVKRVYAEIHCVNPASFILCGYIYFSENCSFNSTIALFI
jgi:hypothetical protein